MWDGSQRRFGLDIGAWYLQFELLKLFQVSHSWVKPFIRPLQGLKAAECLLCVRHPFRSCFIPKHHKCPHCKLGATLIFIYLLCNILCQVIEEGMLCLFSFFVCLFFIFAWLSCKLHRWIVCLDHMISLSYCNLTTKHDTVPTNETPYFVVTVN